MSPSPRSARRPRIAVFVNGFPRLSETFVLDQIAALEEAGLEVRVIAERADPKGVRHERDRIFMENARFAERQPLARLFSASFLPSRVRAWAYHKARLMMDRRALRTFDLVLCHFGPTGLRAVRAAGPSRGTPVWTVFHGYDVSSFLMAHGDSAYEALFASGDRFLPISELWARKLETLGCPPERILVSRMGVNCRSIRFSPRSPAIGEPIRILSVGRLVEKKGAEFSLRALARLARVSPELEWVFEIAGGGPLETELRALAAELGIDQRVRFLGAVTSAQVHECLSRADIFLLPSVVAANGDMEGIPVSLMEAMAAGVPVVSTFHSGIPELVEHGVSGLLAPERDPAALAGLLRELIGSDGRRFALAAAARAKVEAQFDQSRINEALAASIRERILAEAD